MALAAALAGVASFGTGPAAAAAPVPCSAIGGGKYNCNFYVAGDGKSGGAPVKAADGRTVGFLHKGTNWVVCQQVGGRETYGQYFNNNWAWTLADNNQAGWVNAVYASGGDNDGPFGGVPLCNNIFGPSPGGAGAPPGPAGGGVGGTIEDPRAPVGGTVNPPTGTAGLPRLLTQAAIQGGKTAYGKCTGTRGNVTCTGVRLVKLALPPSFGVPANQRSPRVNAEAHEAFRRVVAAIDRAGLGPRIKQFQTWSQRQCRKVSGAWIPGCVSLHSWGVAVDINPSDNNATKDGKPLAEVRKIFLAHRFIWGKTFKNNVDPPHFQYAKA